jgi:hypothetical protein
MADRRAFEPDDILLTSCQRVVPMPTRINGDLARTGLATTKRVILKAGDKVVEVVRITITDAGRMAPDG